MADVVSASAWAAGETLVELDWLSGTWVEKREDGTVIEVIWSAPGGDAMVGTWRVVKDGEMRAYEMLTMRQTDEGVFYRFDLYREAATFDAPGKTVFKLSSIKARRAVFDLVEGAGRITSEIIDGGRLRGALSNPEQPDLPPVVGYDAMPLK